MYLTNRWVRTVKWNKEREAGRSLFGAMNPFDRDESVQGIETDGLANTNIIWHGNKLLALEEGHAPFELDPTRWSRLVRVVSLTG